MGLFGKRKKHKLPKFPPDVIQTFNQLCATLNETELDELRGHVDANVQQVKRDSAGDHIIDADSAAVLGQRCHFLLDHYNDYDAEKQALIVGAVRYFAIADDPLDDGTFATGFHDDKRVVNYVLEELGIEDPKLYFDVF